MEEGGSGFDRVYLLATGMGLLSALYFNQSYKNRKNYREIREKRRVLKNEFTVPAHQTVIQRYADEFKKADVINKGKAIATGNKLVLVEGKLSRGDAWPQPVQWGNSPGNVVIGYKNDISVYEGREQVIKTPPGQQLVLTAQDPRNKDVIKPVTVNGLNDGTYVKYRKSIERKNINTTSEHMDSVWGWLKSTGKLAGMLVLGIFKFTTIAEESFIIYEGDVVSVFGTLKYQMNEWTIENPLAVFLGGRRDALNYFSDAKNRIYSLYVAQFLVGCTLAVGGVTLAYIHFNKKFRQRKQVDLQERLLGIVQDNQIREFDHDQVEDQHKCTACYERARNLILKPCNHVVLCRECFAKMVEKDHENTQCPICRQVVVDVIPISYEAAGPGAAANEEADPQNHNLFDVQE